jgi:hypothetical protein
LRHVPDTDPVPVWDVIREAAREVLWIVFEDSAGTLQARPYGNPIDRGREITYTNLEDLEASSSEDGIYSVVRVLNATGSAVVELVSTPLPRYGRLPYTDREQIRTIDPSGWAAAILADRAWPGVTWTPGIVWCWDANEVEYFASLEIMERVGVVVPGKVDITGRLLGMELWVEARTDTRAVGSSFRNSRRTAGPVQGRRHAGKRPGRGLSRSGPGPYYLPGG